MPGLVAFAAYLLLAGAITWPLPLHLKTHLLGSPLGDTGNYVWNVWIFRHELLRHGHLPLSTNHVFAYGEAADFSLHNYAPIAGAVAAPLVGSFGVVAAFNAVLIGFVALSGLATFALARRLGLDFPAGWFAGALFMASPVLTARQTAHFSLVIAAALPLFMWALLRALDSRRRRDAAVVGAVVAAAYYSDAYYGVFCAVMGAFTVSWRLLRVEFPHQGSPRSRLTAGLTVLIAILIAAILWRVVSGTTSVALGPIRIGLQTLYTPLLIVVLAIGVRIWAIRRPRFRLDDPDDHLPALLRGGVVALVVCLTLLLPPLTLLAVRYVNGRMPNTEIFWRSSPRGVDLLGYLVPNPNHPWFGGVTRAWFMPVQSDAFPEFVASFSLIAVALVCGAAWRRLLPRFWVAFTGLFVWLSLGPFVHIAGINTNIIAPWALLRYVPVIGLARSPSRFAIVAALGLSVLGAFALQALSRRGALQRSIVIVALMLLAAELLPAPRALYSAAVPEVYQLVAAGDVGDEAGRLLELPTGIRDGTSSIGDFSASSEYFQTVHRRPLIGGYLSRVSRWRKTESRRAPLLHAIFTLSEGENPARELLEQARQSRDAFLRRACVRFVLLDKRRASEALRAFAVDTLRLTLVHEDESYALFTPIDPPPCAPPPSARALELGPLAPTR